MKRDRVISFVDRFNLYHGIDNLNSPPLMHKTGEKTLTTRGKIYYAKNGVHVVPALPQELIDKGLYEK